MLLRQPFLFTTICSLSILLSTLSFSQTEDSHKKAFIAGTYISTDRPFYSVEEDIHFTIFQRRKPSTAINKEQVLFVNELGEVLSTVVVELIDGIGSGRIFLEDSLKSGAYNLVIPSDFSTKQADDVCSKQLVIINPFLPNAPFGLNSINTSDHLSSVKKVIFFPEGGRLINNLSSKVGFKAIDSYGGGVSVVGKIVDSKGNTITNIKSDKTGAGIFFLRPLPAERYHAVFNLKDSSFKDFPVPVASSKGVLVSLSDSLNDYITFKITCSEDTCSSSSSYELVVAELNGRPVFSDRIETVDGKGMKIISKRNLPKGLTQISISDEKQNLVNRRWFFVDSADLMDLSIKANKSTFAPREKTNLEIELHQSGKEMDEAFFSVAVIDKNQIDPDHYRNIKSEFSFLQYLRGNIDEELYNEVFYQPLSEEILNLALSTIAAVEVNAPKGPSFASRKPNSIKGTVSDLKGTPSGYSTIRVTGHGDSSLFLYTTADALGHFEVPVTLEESKRVLVTAISSTWPKENLVIKLTENGVMENFKRTKQPVSIDALKNYYRKALITASIREGYRATAEDSLEEVTEVKHRRSEIEVAGNTLVELDKYQNFSTMQEVIKEIVPGFRFKKEKSELQIRLLSLDTKLFYTEEPLYFIDNINVPDLKYIIELDPFLVENVVVISSAEKLLSFGPLASNGIFAVNTKGRDYNPSHIRNSVSVQVQGEEKKGDVPFQSFSSSLSEPQFSSLLYWNPKVNTDKNGKATISFYNTDAIGPKEVIIEGMAKDGTPFFKTYTYEVELGQ